MNEEGFSMFLIIYFIPLEHFSQAGTRRVYIMRTVDEEDEENFPLKYLQQRQVLFTSDLFVKDVFSSCHFYYFYLQVIY